MPARILLAAALVFMGNASGAPAEVTGTVVYRQRVALPPDAVVHVRLEDVSRADAPATVIAEADLDPGGRQVPIPFRLAYDPGRIDTSHRYVVRSTISAGKRLLFTSTAAYPVITGGAPSHVEVVVMPAEAPAPPQTAERALAPPVTFEGVLPAADRPGMRVTLTLRADGVYLQRTAFLGGKVGTEESRELGRWSLEDGGRRLVLRGGRGRPEQYEVRSDRVLRRLDDAGRAIASKLNYDLVRKPSVDPIKGSFRLRGMYTYMADAALFADCSTGLRWPVAAGRDAAALERAYAGARPAPGAPVMVTLDGHLATGDLGEREVLVVDRTQRAWPGERCPPGAGATLEETRWKIVEVDGSPVRVGVDQREPHILLRTAGKQLTGFTGCNDLVGTYERGTETLRLVPSATTAKACIDPSMMQQERAILDALRAANDARIAGAELELRRGERVLVRLEARDLR